MLHLHHPNGLHLGAASALLLLATACATVPAPPPPLPPLTEPELALLEQVGGEVTPDENIRLGRVTILRREREIAFPAAVNMTGGELEVLICTERGRRHESLLVCDVKALDLQLAMHLLGWENGTRKPGGAIDQGDLLGIDVQPVGGTRVPIERWLYNKKTDTVQDQPGPWVFIGSSFDHTGASSAEVDGNIVNLWSFGGTVLDNPTETGDADDWFDVSSATVPPFETPVTVYLRKLPSPDAP
jgi:hypothetical protein